MTNNYNRRTTESWEDILAGDTEGPWVRGERGIDGPDHRVVVSTETETDGSGHLTSDVPVLRGDNLDKDMALLVEARELAEEVVYLRKAMTQLRKEYLDNISGFHDGTVTHMCYGTAADDIEMILNGEWSVDSDTE